MTADDFSVSGPEMGRDYDSFDARVAEWAAHTARTVETPEEMLAHVVHEFGLWSDASWPDFAEWRQWSGYAADVYRYAKAIEDMALRMLVSRQTYLEASRRSGPAIESGERLDALLRIEGKG
jgi:hypothetical protein